MCANIYAGGRSPASEIRQNIIPVSRARPEKFVRFLLAAPSNHVQVMLD